MARIEEHFQRSCQEKRKYTTSQEAVEAARRQMISDLSAPDLDIYKCTYCSGWHLTSKK